MTEGALIVVVLALMGAWILQRRRTLRALDDQANLDFDHGFVVWVTPDGGITWRPVLETPDFVEACEHSLLPEYADLIPSPEIRSARTTGKETPP